MLKTTKPIKLLFVSTRTDRWRDQLNTLTANVDFTYANSGNGALYELSRDQSSQQEFDIIIIDHSLPDLDPDGLTTIIQGGKHSNNAILGIITQTTEQKTHLNLDKHNSFNNKKPEVLSLIHQLINFFEYTFEGQDNIAEPLEQPILDRVIFDSLNELFGETFPNVFEKTLQANSANLSRLEAAAKTNDIKAIERASHSILGSSAQFGGTRVHLRAREIEKLAAKGDILKIKHLIPALAEEYSLFESTVRNQFNKKS